MGVLGDAWSGLTGKTSGKFAKKAGEDEREQLNLGLDYLKGRDELGNKFGDQALEGLGNLYTGDQSYQTDMIERAKGAPMYQEMMLAKEDAREGIQRDASMTGGLRSGNAIDATYDSDLRYDAKALSEGYQNQVQGLEGLTGYRDQNTGGITDLYGKLGSSYANEAVARGNAKNQGVSNLMGIAGAASNFYSPPKGGGWSDPRLKKDIEYLGEIKGNSIYRWHWNEKGEELGLCGESVGVLAHEVNEEHPEAVTIYDGYLAIDYDALGLDLNALNLMEIAHA